MIDWFLNGRKFWWSEKIKSSSFWNIGEFGFPFVSPVRRFLPPVLTRNRDSYTKMLALLHGDMGEHSHSTFCFTLVCWGKALTSLLAVWLLRRETTVSTQYWSARIDHLTSFGERPLHLVLLHRSCTWVRYSSWASGVWFSGAPARKLMLKKKINKIKIGLQSHFILVWSSQELQCHPSSVVLWTDL